MVNHEWALILYTLLTQTAIGAYIMIFVINKRLKDKIGEEKSYDLILPTQYIVGVLVIIGLALSLFHLGTPSKAVYAILSLGSSWLSREVLLTVVFACLWLLTVGLARKNKKFSAGLMALTSSIGLVTIYAMSKIYITTLIPAWQGLYTFVAFYATSFILGTLLAIAITVLVMNKQKISHQKQLFKNVLTPISSIILIAIAIQVILVPNYLVSLVGQAGAGQATAQLLSEKFALAMGLRWFLTFLGGMVLILLVWRQFKQTEAEVLHQKAHTETAATSDESTIQTISAGLIYLAFAVLVVGEVIGRYLFYASGVKMMLGMM